MGTEDTRNFYGIREMIGLFHQNGFKAECIQNQAAHFKSSSIFVIREVKVK
jgi:hypothetical protein